MVYRSPGTSFTRKDALFPLTGVVDRAIVAIGDREAYLDPADLRSVDPEPYD
jgi:hypothetical protein